MRCIFNPVRTDDLIPDALEAIGKEFYMMASWIIEEGCYKGQWAMMPESEEGRLFGWVPEQDIDIII